MANVLKSSKGLFTIMPRISSRAKSSRVWICIDSTTRKAWPFYRSEFSSVRKAEEGISRSYHCRVMPSYIALMARCYEILRSIISTSIIQMIGFERAVLPRQSLRAPVTRMSSGADLVEEDHAMLQKTARRIRQWMTGASSHEVTSRRRRSRSRWIMLPLPPYVTRYRAELSGPSFQLARGGVPDERLLAVSALASEPLSASRLLRTAPQRTVAGSFTPGFNLESNTTLSTEFRYHRDLYNLGDYIVYSSRGERT